MNKKLWKKKQILFSSSKCIEWRKGQQFIDAFCDITIIYIRGDVLRESFGMERRNDLTVSFRTAPFIFPWYPSRTCDTIIHWIKVSINVTIIQMIIHYTKHLIGRSDSIMNNGIKITINTNCVLPFLYSEDLWLSSMICL